MRWFNCNTFMSTFFDMDRKIPFIQLYGQFLNIHTQLQIFYKINMTVFSQILQFCWGILFLQSSPRLHFQISMYHIPARTDGLCGPDFLLCFCHPRLSVALRGNAGWQSEHHVNASYHLLLYSARKKGLW